MLHPFAMSESQLSAARAALAGPLTVITGPPGTGKSQVIAAIMISAAAAGRSVLFAARQHRALDAVQERLEAATGDRPLLVRANDAGQAAGFIFGQAVQALLTRPEAPDAPQRLARALRRAEELDRERCGLIDRWQALDDLSRREAALLDEQDRLTSARDREAAAARAKGLDRENGPSASAGWLHRLFARLCRLGRNRCRPAGGHVAQPAGPGPPPRSGGERALGDRSADRCKSVGISPAARRAPSS